MFKYNDGIRMDTVTKPANAYNVQEFIFSIWNTLSLLHVSATIVNSFGEVNYQDYIKNVSEPIHECKTLSLKYMIYIHFKT
jgi:hypothetical protein